MITCNKLCELINNINSHEYKDKYEELINIYPNDIDKIKHVFLDIYNYEYSIGETENRLDTQFRKAVIKKYKKCIITNKPLKVCEVVHIYPFSKSSYNEKYDHDNGLLLCSELHKLFDNKDVDLKINIDTLQIELSEEILKDDSMLEYHKYNNNKLELSEKNIYYLNKKYNE